MVYIKLYLILCFSSMLYNYDYDMYDSCYIMLNSNSKFQSKKINK